jgi:hypothetical protein
MTTVQHYPKSVTFEDSQKRPQAVISRIGAMTSEFGGGDPRISK